MEKDIGKIKKNEITDIVVRIDDFGGKVGLTIREYVTGDRYTGFTKAGTRISAENFFVFKDLINSIDENDFQLKESEKKEESEEKDKEKEKKTKKKDSGEKKEESEDKENEEDSKDIEEEISEEKEEKEGN